MALCNVVPQRETERLTNSTSTRHIVPDLEFLYASAGLLDQLANKEGTNCVRRISLFCVCLDNYASIERGLVGFLVFAGEVRVNRVSHVCGNQERLRHWDATRRSTRSLSIGWCRNAYLMRPTGKALGTDALTVEE